MNIKICGINHLLHEKKDIEIEAILEMGEY